MVISYHRFYFEVVSFLSIYLLDFFPAKYKEGGYNRWYFFTPRDRKYPNGNRPNRRTLDGSGYWKPTGVEKPIENENGVKIGARKTLVFYAGKSRNGEKTEWIMHEYIKKDASDRPRKPDGTMQLDECVLCTIQRKRGADDVLCRVPQKGRAYRSQVTTARSNTRRTIPQVQQTPQNGGELVSVNYHTSRNIGGSNGCTANHQALLPNNGRELVPNHQVIHNIGSNDGNTNYQATLRELFAFGGQLEMLGPRQDQVTQNVARRYSSNQAFPQEPVLLNDQVICSSNGSYDSSADHQRSILKDGRVLVPLNGHKIGNFGNCSSNANSELIPGSIPLLNGSNNAYYQVIPHDTAELIPLTDQFIDDIEIDGSNAMFIYGHGHHLDRPLRSEVIPPQHCSLPIELPEIDIQHEANMVSWDNEFRAGVDNEHQFPEDHNTMNQPSDDNSGNFGDNSDSGF